MKSKCFIIIYYQLLFAIGIQYNYHIEIKSLFIRAESAIPTQNLHEHGFTGKNRTEVVWIITWYRTLNYNRLFIYRATSSLNYRSHLMLHQPHQSRSRAENMKTSSRQTEKAIFSSALFISRRVFPRWIGLSCSHSSKRWIGESYSTVPGLVVLCFFFFF